MNITEREEHKDRARELLSKASTKEEKSTALWMMIEAYYYRNLNSGSVENYAGHYLKANWHDEAETYTIEAVEHLIETHRLELPTSARIKSGYSDYS